VDGLAAGTLVMGFSGDRLPATLLVGWGASAWFGREKEPAWCTSWSTSFCAKKCIRLMPRFPVVKSPG